MCKYCSDNGYTGIINQRTTMADDNTCEFLTGDGYSVYDCDGCIGCREGQQLFEVSYYTNFYTITYYKNIGELTVHPVSERINMNFCHNCGRKLN